MLFHGGTTLKGLFQREYICFIHVFSTAYESISRKANGPPVNCAWASLVARNY